MSDKEKDMLGDEEYQFPNDEYAVDESTEVTEDDYADVYDDEQQESRFSFLQGRKRVIAAVVVAGLAFLGFKFYDAAKNTQLPVASQPEPTVQASAPKPQPVTTVVDPSPEIMQRMRQLGRAVLERDDAINSLQAQLQNMQQQLQKSTQANEQLSQHIDDMSDQLAQLNQKVVELSKPKVAAKPKAKQKPVREITFELVAVEPGRAWIRSSEGDAETVRVGDNLPQYGKVVAVDLSRGIVLTSSGKVITYGANDS